jgi:hypothetical protein
MGSTAVEPAQSAFRHYADTDTYECLGCHGLIPVPRLAILEEQNEIVRIKDNPLNRMLWLEVLEEKHQNCAHRNHHERIQGRSPLLAIPHHAAAQA